MWEIGVLRGSAPCALLPGAGHRNPVLTAKDVTDIEAEFVADPFMLRKDDEWHLFFEVLRKTNKLGEIGLATSRDASHWQYQRIVLREEFHLSYPHVFEWEGHYYMVPETLDAGEVRLYESTDFPFEWRFRSRLIAGRFADPTIFRHGGRWWMFVCGNPQRHDSLRLFGASDLAGPWEEHPSSPLVSFDSRFARPAGRVTSYDGRLVRFAQDCSTEYGSRVWAFEILRLDAEGYEECPVSPVPVIGGDAHGSWPTSRMHHIDPHPQPGGEWIACVDGWRANGHLRA